MKAPIGNKENINLKIEYLWSVQRCSLRILVSNILATRSSSGQINIAPIKILNICDTRDLKGIDVIF